jgi:hypothetical protein
MVVAPYYLQLVTGTELRYAGHSIQVAGSCYLQLVTCN